MIGQLLWDAEGEKNAKDWAAITKVFGEAWAADPAGHKGTARPVFNLHNIAETNEPVRYSFEVWYGKEPDAAMAWLKTVADAELRTEAVARLVRTGKLEVSIFPGSQERFEFAKGIVQVEEDGTAKSEADLGIKPLPPALKRMAELEGRPPKDEVWARLSTEDRHYLSAEAVSIRAGYAPDGIKFFNSMKPEERSLGAWYEAGKAYVEEDAGKASQWMKSLPPGPERDAAATALVEQLTAEGKSRDGEAAFSWAEAMSGEAERARYMVQAAEAWAQENAAAAQAAVAAASGLSEEEKRRLLRQLEKGGAR